MDRVETNRLLLQAAMTLAPTGVEQRAFADLANLPMDPEQVTVVLLGGMLDGTRHGNWPVARPTAH
jgi:hypothetical protein